VPDRHGPWWGYHQLDSRWAERLVAAAGIVASDIVLDVGAGSGALTTPLVATGARVVAIELHDRRARALKSRFESRQVVVVWTDASDLRLPRRPFKVVANPPFSVTTSLLRRLLAPGSRLVRADIVVPAHVAARWVSGSAPGAGRWHQQFQLSVVQPLPRRAFNPPATTPTVVLRIDAIGAPSPSGASPVSRRRSGRARPRAPALTPS
jgi:23S rRNA (adenine-N6)-dimethyltransferase